MKKTLVALAVAAFATSASAVTVYDNEGTKLDVKGQVKVELKKEKDKAKTTRADLVEGGSRVEFIASHKLSDDLNAVGGIRLRVKNSAVETNRYYVGFDSKSAGKVTFGKQPLSTDGLDASDYTNEYGGVSQVTGAADKSVVYTSPKFGGVTFGAHYLFGENDRTKRADGDNKVSYTNGFGAAVKFEQKLNEQLTLKANAGFSQENYKTAANAKYDLVAGNVKRNAWIVSAAVGNDKFDAGVTYTAAKSSKGANINKHEFAKQEQGAGNVSEITVGLNELQALGVGAQVKVTPEVAIYGHYAYQTGKTSKKAAMQYKAKGHSFAVGSSYKIHKNVSTYVEYGTSKWKVNSVSFDRDHKTTVGLGLTF